MIDEYEEDERDTCFRKSVAGEAVTHSVLKHYVLNSMLQFDIHNTNLAFDSLSV